MKITVIALLISAAALCFVKTQEGSNEAIQTQKTNIEPIQLNSINYPAKTSVVEKVSLSLSDLENRLKLYGGKNYEDFSQEELGIYNQLVLQRAILLKKQIFNKAAKMGYYL